LLFAGDVTGIAPSGVGQDTDRDIPCPLPSSAVLSPYKTLCIRGLAVAHTYFQSLYCASRRDITLLFAVFFDIEIDYNQAVRQTPLR